MRSGLLHRPDLQAGLPVRALERVEVRAAPAADPVLGDEAAHRALHAPDWSGR